jgi:hypothetical protein
MINGRVHPYSGSVYFLTADFLAPSNASNTAAASSILPDPAFINSDLTNQSENVPTPIVVGPPTLTGPQGIQGPMGLPGIAGPIGLTGPAGRNGSTTLAGDTDVTITSPINGQVLSYNGNTANWSNTATTILIGNSSILSGNAGYAFGSCLNDNGNTGGMMHGGIPASGFATTGSAQHESFFFSGQASGGTISRITTDAQTASQTNVASLPFNSAAIFSITMMAFDQTTQAAVSWQTNNGLATQGSNAASLLFAPDPVLFSTLHSSFDAPDVDLPVVLADTIFGGFNISWTPPIGDQWNVVAYLTLLKTGV